MSKTKRLSITVPIEIYAQCYGTVKQMVALHQLEQAAKERMEANLLNVAKNA